MYLNFTYYQLLLIVNSALRFDVIQSKIRVLTTPINSGRHMRGRQRPGDGALRCARAAAVHATEAE